MSHLKSLTSLQHPLVKHFVKLRSDSHYRYAQQSLVLEGLKPILEISHLVTKIFYTPTYAPMIESLAGEKWQVTEAILEKISGLSSPEGVIAEMRMPSFVNLKEAYYVLALDGINDPGNMGTLMRTALAFGWDTVCFLSNSCDPFNEKVLRAARGAHFKVNLVKSTAEQLQTWVKETGGQAMVAELQGLSPKEVKPISHRLLVLGNEAHGPSESIKDFCAFITLPMPGEMESLNVAVAGGILLYLLSNSNQS